MTPWRILLFHDLPASANPLYTLTSFQKSDIWTLSPWVRKNLATWGDHFWQLDHKYRTRVVIPRVQKKVSSTLGALRWSPPGLYLVPQVWDIMISLSVLPRQTSMLPEQPISTSELLFQALLETYGKQ